MNIKQIVFSAHSSERNCNVILALTGFQTPWASWMEDEHGNYHYGRYMHHPVTMEDAVYCTDGNKPPPSIPC